jgi:hypothetical protein
MYQCRLSKDVDVNHKTRNARYVSLIDRPDSSINAQASDLCLHLSSVIIASTDLDIRFFIVSAKGDFMIKLVRYLIIESHTFGKYYYLFVQLIITLLENFEGLILSISANDSLTRKKRRDNYEH